MKKGPFDYKKAEADLYSVEAPHPTDVYEYGTKKGFDHYMRENGLNPDKYRKPVKKNTNQSGGGCYLTTACTAARGLGDHCTELETLRFFRDQVLARRPGGREEIEAYYRMAPAIVEAIDRRPDAHEIWGRVYEGLVAPCVTLIQRGQQEEAFRHYKAFALSLEEKYGQ